MSTPEIVSRTSCPASIPCVDPDLHTAFVMTLEHRRPHLQRLAMRMMRCPEDAEDVLQESLLKALQFLPRFRGEARIETWLHAIVVNTARDWLRLRQQRPHISLEAPCEESGGVIALDLPHPGDNPEESCSRQELLRLLQAEIRRLEPAYQMPIVLCDLNDRSYREAALMLKLTGPAIKARLFRARVQLKNRLSPQASLSASPTPAAHRGRRRSPKSRNAAGALANQGSKTASS